jgi:DNA-binding transcriptional LysR family regulator
MNLTHLRVFRAVLENNSITAAARSLRISQPAASKQLAELESSLGVSLMERRPRGVRLTAAGELLGRHARRLFQEEEAAEAGLQALLGLELGKLAVGASTTVGNYIVPALFGQLYAAHPRLGLELEIANTSRIQQLLLEGRLDLGLIEGLVGTDGLYVEVFTHDEMVLVVAPQHPLARGTPEGSAISQSELVAVPYISRERGSGTREVVEEALARFGIALQPIMSFGSTEAVKNAVAQGLGAAIVSRLTIDLELQSGRLRVLAIQDVRILRALRLLTLEGKPPSPGTLEFRRLLRARYPSEALLP